MLWMYQRVFFGELSEDVKHHMPEINLREWVCIAPLIVMMVWMGLFTQTFLPAVSETNAHILSGTGGPVASAVIAGGGAAHAR